jgi:Na+-transporting NADH:ubiquinone oxidoreductase subunit NqrB
VSSEPEAQPTSEGGEGAWARPISNRTGEMIMAAALLGAAIFFVWQSLSLPFGSFGLPGPGFFPFVLGIVLALFAIAIFARVYSGPGGDPVHLGHRDVLFVFAALAGVAATFEALGAYASLGAFTATLLLAIAKSAPWRVALGTGLGMVAVWVVFKVLLGVQLPAGPF